VPADPPEGYEFLGILGRGGVGVVYKAWQHKLKRIVAVKMLLTDRHKADDLARFGAEAEIFARLQHPNIVQIYEVGEHHGQPFLALEFVDGESLANRLDGTPQSPRAAAELIETLARAMHYAHEQGIVHRDLKPANILLQRIFTTEDAEERRGREAAAFPLRSSASSAVNSFIPKITDFGLAKRLDEQGQTQTGQVLGTPSYMAPEQARGQSAAIRPATDIYALGAILYQLLTGRPPFQGVTSVDTVMQVLHQDPVPPRRLQPKLARDLNTICLKCLEKDSRRRYTTALELAEDLRRFRCNEPIRARRIGVLGQGQRWCRRNPALAGALASLLLVLVGAIAGIGRAYVVAEQARTREAEQHARAETHLYFSRIALAEREWLANNVARAEHLLDQCVPKAGQSDRRAWEWYYLKRLCHADLCTLEEHRFPVYGLAYSPNGQYLVSAGGDPAYNRDPRTTPGELMIWDADHYRKLGDFTGLPDRVGSVAFNRDGSRLASVGTADNVRLWDVASRRLLAVLPCKMGRLWEGSSAAFAPDGKTLAIPDGWQVKLLDLGNGAVSATFAGPKERVGRVTFSPDGSRLAAGSATAIFVWDVRTNRELSRVPGNAPAVAFAPDGKLLAGASGSTVQLWEAASGRLGTSLAGHEARVRALAWHPNARFLASAGADQTVRVWDVSTGQVHRVFRGHTQAILSLAYRPDGGQVASGDEGGLVKFWNATEDQRAVELTPAAQTSALAFTREGSGMVAVTSGHPNTAVRGWSLETGQETLHHSLTLAHREEWPLQYVCLSPDGRLCAGPAREDQSVLRVLEATTGQEVAALQGHHGRIRTVAFSPDGQHLASASGGRVPEAIPELFVWLLPLSGQPPAPPLHLATPAGVQCLAFSSDGRRLATGHLGSVSEQDKTPKDGSLSVWDVVTGRLQARWVGHPGTVQCVAFDPSGRRLASGGRMPDDSVKLWETDTGRPLYAVQGPTALTGLTFSPDGRRLAAVGYDGWVQLWDTDTGQDVLTVRGSSRQRPDGKAADSQVVFSPDGTRLAVNSWEEVIYIWHGRPSR
jgi:WD40 repeat protein